MNIGNRVHWWVPPIPSFSLVDGFPFLVKCPNTFPPIFCWNHAVVSLNLKHHSASQIHVQPHVHGLLELTSRNRRVAGDDGGGLQRIRQQNVRCAEPVDHAPFQGFLRREWPARQHNFLGSSCTHCPGKILC